MLKRPKRTIRFVLFNAEEVGLVGSGEYAQKALVPWAFWELFAVCQMDMIGYKPPTHAVDRRRLARGCEIVDVERRTGREVHDVL